MITDRDLAQLRAIDDLVAWSRRTGGGLWLRGGWAMDFTLGRVTRRHADIDWFVDVDALPALQADLLAQGWKITRTQVNAVDFGLGDPANGLDHGIQTVRLLPDGTGVVAAGPHAGEPWPNGMLTAPELILHKVTCPVISLAAQIEIKQQMPNWVPGLPVRAKDQHDLRLLRHAQTAARRVGGDRPPIVEP